jgi:acetyl/propionyl-CoA carboxylase alpha subunit
VPPEYDNLIAKVLVVAPDRDRALDRLRRALDEAEVGGIQTTVPFHRFVAWDASFRAGALSTGWVEEHWRGAPAFERAERLARAAAGLAAVSAASRGGLSPTTPGPKPPPDGARQSGWAEAGFEAGVDRWPG